MDRLHVGNLATSPMLSQVSPALIAWTKIRVGKLAILHHFRCLRVLNSHQENIYHNWVNGLPVGKIATSPLLSQGCPTLNTAKNQKWLTGPMWAKQLDHLHHPCFLRGPRRSSPGHTPVRTYIRNE